MKKKSLLAIAMVAAIFVTACGQSNQKKSEEELKAQIEELQAQLNEAQGGNGTDNGVEETIDSSENMVSEEGDSSDEEVQSIKAQAVKYDETISTDFIEFSFSKAATAQEIKPDNPEGVYSYIPDEDNETYMYLKGTIKNIGTEKYEVARSSYCKLIVDDKYEYNASITADEGGDFSYIYAYLDPFQSETFYISASVPDELVNQYTKMTFYFGFKDNFEDSYSSEDECDYLYSLTATK